MSITSYAQNFEDVMLWRALGHVPNGFYIDVGAQHPIVDSVSKAFYEHGWRGVHIEATPRYAALVKADRPDELVLQVALSDKPGSLTLYEIPNTGLSTGDASIAEHHRSRDYNVVETVVPCTTLAEVLTQVGSRDVHWLKVDVEGMEALVLTGWEDHPTRPWVLVVESTYPNSQVETHQAWESMLLERGYTFTYFDGLSRYYVHADRTDLIQKFASPPNIFDGFSLAPSVPYNGPIRELIQQNEQRHEGELADKAHQLQEMRDALTVHDDALNSQIAQLQNQVHIASEQKEAALAERNNEVHRHIDELRQQHGNEIQKAEDKERELHAALQELQMHAAQEKLLLANEHAATYQALHVEHTEREKTINLLLQASQDERLRQRNEQLEREQSLLEQTNQAKQEVENVLRVQLQREQTITEKLEAVHAQTAQERVELARTHAAQQTELNSRDISREQAFQAKVQNAQQEVEKLLRIQAQREQAFAEKLDSVRAQVWQDNKELVRSLTDQQTAFHNQHIAHEQALNQHRTASDEQRRQLLQDHNQRELLLQEKNQQAWHEIENLLHTQLVREQDISTQLAAHQRQAAHDKSELLQSHAEKVHDLKQQHAQYEEALTHELDLHQQELHKLRVTYKALEDEAAAERVALAQLHNEQMNALRSQQSESDIAHSQQLLNQQKALQQQKLEQLSREAALAQEHEQIRQQLRALQTTAEQREQELIEQLQVTQQQTAQHTADLLRIHGEQELALQKLHARRETDLTQQLDNQQRQLELYKQEWAQLEQAFQSEIAAHKNEAHSLLQAHHSQLAQYDQELSAALKQHSHLLEVYAATELNLQAEVESQQNNSDHLKLLLAEAVQQIENTQASLSWRATAPLRKLAGLYTSNKNQPPHHPDSGEAYPPKSDTQIATKPLPITVKPASNDSTMQPPVQPPSLNMSTIALTLSELMAHHDQNFVECAYRTLLGRAPDADGLRYYTSRLRTGFAKISVLAQLHLSAEGKAHASKLTGLDKAIKRHTRAQQPFIGWLFRLIDGSEGNSPIERKLRGIEYRLDVLNDESKHRSSQIDTIFLELQQSIKNLTLSGIIPNQRNDKFTPLTSANENRSSSQTTDSHNLIDKFVYRIYEEIDKSNIISQS